MENIFEMIRFGSDYVYGSSKNSDQYSINLQNINEEFDSFEKEVNEAINLLKSKDTLSLDEDFISYLHLPEEEEEEDEEPLPEMILYERLYKSFMILDRVVFVMIATKHFPNISGNTELQQKASKLFDKVFDEVPTLRLVPLNTFRKKMLNYIPDDYQYLFSWYEDYNNLPSDIFEKLIMSKAGLIKTKEKEQNILTFLEREMLDDPDLNQHLQNSIQKMDIISKACNEAYKLRWLNTADKMAQHFSLPASVVS